MGRKRNRQNNMAAMGKKDDEFLRILCSMYMIALLVAVPLHTGGVY